MPQLRPCSCSPQTRGPILHQVHGFCPSWQLLLVLDTIRWISIAQKVDRPPQRLICRLDLVANRVTWSGFLLVLPGCPLHRSNQPAAPPRGAGAARERRGSGAGAALVGSQRGVSKCGRGCRQNAGASQGGRRQNAGRKAVSQRAAKAVKAVRPPPTRRAGAPVPPTATERHGA